MRNNQRLAGISSAPPSTQDVALTGDRPTGRLHLGHYVGSIVNRLTIQDICPQVLLIADLQALTDNAGRPSFVKDNVLEVMLDYLACGIDPERTTICLQSGIPELSELTVLYMNLVGLGTLKSNPTVKQEMASRAFVGGVPVGFVAYPVSQAADVTAFGATIVPVGADQLPILEVTDRIVAALERMAGSPVLPRPRPLLSSSPRLPGIDGRGKASKSAGNTIEIGEDMDSVRRKVNQMYTDPDHLRPSDPGKVEGNVVFAHLEAFDPDREGLEDLKRRYAAGGVGDMTVKLRLIETLDDTLSPIRERRARLAKDPAQILSILRDGTERARATATRNLDRVRKVFGLDSRR